MNMFTVLMLILSSIEKESPKKYLMPTKNDFHNKKQESVNTKEIIVECNVENENLIKSMGVIKHRLPMINSYVVEIPECDINKIDGLECVTAVHQNAHITAQMDKTKMTIKSDSIRYTGKGVTIAILDTGISPVKDFIYPHNRIIAFKDFINSKKTPYDDNGHGTHVAWLK